MRFGMIFTDTHIFPGKRINVQDNGYIDIICEKTGHVISFTPQEFSKLITELSNHGVIRIVY